MAHIHIDHFVLGVRPHNGQIAAFERVLEAEWIVRPVERQQHLDIFIETRARLPDVPLVGGRSELRRQVPSDRI